MHGSGAVERSKRSNLIGREIWAPQRRTIAAYDLSAPQAKLRVRTVEQVQHAFGGDLDDENDG